MRRIAYLLALSSLAFAVGCSERPHLGFAPPDSGAPDADTADAELDADETDAAVADAELDAAIADAEPDASDPCSPNPCGVGTCTPRALSMARFLYECTCPTGFESNDATCVDVNECVTGALECDPLTVCNNTEGSASCSPCPTGYSGTGATGCVDVDECAEGTHACPSTPLCTNTVGGYTCGSCPVGYTVSLADGTCVDINECTAGTAVCDPLTTCTNTDGAYTCTACPSGYSGTGLTGCLDINECTSGALTCLAPTTCVNAPGSASCTPCPSGYAGNGAIGCTDIDECVAGTDDCTDHQHCVNTVGSFTCHDAINMVTGGSDTCVVFDNGDMKCWGSGGYGLPSTPRSAAIDLGGAFTVRSVDVRNTRVCAIYNDGTLHCRGVNTSGVLGYGDAVTRTSFGAAVDLGAGCTNVGAGTSCSIDEIGLGEYATCSIMNGGDLKCWGVGIFGTLGYGDGTARFAPEATATVNTGGRVVQTVGGNAHQCVVLSTGAVKCWGLSDASGAPGSSGGDRLGYGTVASLSAPSMSAVNLGTGCGGTCSAVRVETTTRSTCALLRGGYIKCWGWNDYGQLGTGDNVGLLAPNATTPINLGGNCGGGSCVAAGLDADYYHVCALMRDGSVKCWGDNSSGQLGTGDTANRNAPPAAPVDFGAGRYATHVGTGASFSCALLDDRSVRCWGTGRDGATTPVNLRGRGLL